MPYYIKSIKRGRRPNKSKTKKCWSVRTNKKSRNNRTKTKIFSKCTTKKKALKQMTLLNAIKYNPNFKRRLVNKRN